jgi:endonuclease III
MGAPGAEKVLLFTKTYPILALESNGLRVLLRLGFGEERRNYSASYLSVQEALQDQIANDCDFLIEAHLLLRRHGKELCRTNNPACEICPVSRSCAYY